MVAIALIIALFLGGGVSFAAENAVPGDTLYIVKTEVNENVRAAVAMSAEADARWHATAAARRLAEAKELTVRGHLTAEAAAQLSADFSEHAEAAIEGASALAADGKSEAASEIQAQLEATVAVYAELFADANAYGEATARTFVLPHVLEKSGIRVSAGDLDGDGAAETRVNKIDAITVKQRTVDGGTIKSETSVKAEGGSNSEASTETQMEGSVQVDVGF